MTATQTVDSTFTFGPLYDLLKAKFPDYRTDSGRFDVPKFAAEMRMSPEGVYKWLRSNKLTPDRAKQVVALSGTAIALEDLNTFVFA